MGAIKPAPRNIGAEVRTLAACGFTKQGVAQHFGVSLPTLNRWMEEDGEMQESFNAGREDERQALHNALYKRAIEKGDTVASIFLLKSRHGYREGDQSDQSNKVAIVFNLPGAMKSTDYRASGVVVGTMEGSIEDGDARATAKRLPS
ncbi:MAG: hypothetical protein PW792_10240 [Acidobacteriaceae bacterium]|nr:hypothetical protein [Acidobacteriaceae bacterium]